MTLTDVFDGQSVRSTQLVQRGSLILFALIASLMLAFRRHNGILLGVIVALICLVAPAAYLIAQRIREKVRQRETEDRLMSHTRTYLQSEEPVRYGPAAGSQESDLEFLARTIDGQKLPLQDFRDFGGTNLLMPSADPVVFDALPRLYATQNGCARRFDIRAARLPAPASVPLLELSAF